jgi:hypothetical protein
MDAVARTVSGDCSRVSTRQQVPHWLQVPGIEEPVATIDSLLRKYRGEGVRCPAQSPHRGAQPLLRAAASGATRPSATRVCRFGDSASRAPLI